MGHGTNHVPSQHLKRVGSFATRKTRWKYLAVSSIACKHSLACFSQNNPATQWVKMNWFTQFWTENLLELCLPLIQKLLLPLLLFKFWATTWKQLSSIYLVTVDKFFLFQKCFSLLCWFHIYSHLVFTLQLSLWPHTHTPHRKSNFKWNTSSQPRHRLCSRNYFPAFNPSFTKHTSRDLSSWSGVGFQASQVS